MNDDHHRAAARRGVGPLLALALAWPALAGAIQLEPVLSNLSSPVFVTGAGDGSGRLFVVEQRGVIKVREPGATSATVFLDITDRVKTGGERGLLGLAFHPKFASNRRFFVDYTRMDDGAIVIAEFQVPLAAPGAGDPSTERVLLTVGHADFSNHNGGMLAFGPDGFLYIGTGDGGSAWDPGNHAQNTGSLLGKILRIDVDTGDPYASPAGNPFVGRTGRDEIYALGMRNPWRFSFDREAGDLVVADVGQGTLEEVNVVVAGGNYGWRVFEGTDCTDRDPALCENPENYVPPLFEYTHDPAFHRCSITGGYVYRGTRGAVAFGSYVFGDFCSGEIFKLNGLHEAATLSVLASTDLAVSSFGEDDLGELYVVGLGGTVHRITNGCAYGLSRTSKWFSRASASGSLKVTAAGRCRWRAASNVDWITITSAVARKGTQQVTYTVAPNPTGQRRIGTLTIAGEVFTVTQGK